MKQNQGNKFYVGAWKNGYPEGEAFIYEPRRILFLGTFVDGLPTGRATLKFIRESIEFSGELKEGQAHG